MRWVRWQIIKEWVLKEWRTKLKAYDCILRRSTKKWQKSDAGVDDVYDTLVCLQTPNVYFGLDYVKGNQNRWKVHFLRTRKVLRQNVFVEFQVPN
jgi:hypothetical protein